MFAAPIPIDADVLQNTLDSVLANLREKRLLDDATVGVLVTGTAVACQHRLCPHPEKEETDGSSV